jgi:hypothetical protein
MKRNENIYLKLVYANLPRVLTMFDTDVISKTYGVGDRFYWGWKLTDFANGTFQGAANGLARLLVSGMLPTFISSASVLNRIDSIFYAAGRLRRKNGSMEEAFPYESSFCVTALVAYDLLTAIELLDKMLGDDQRSGYLNTIEPMIKFLRVTEEKHGFISNHLATAAAAMFKWNALTGTGGDKGKKLVDRILQHQSAEGWFKEYEGADPGYQTLCMYYLADIHERQRGLGLLEPLSKAVNFLWHFAHPDGSFGGMYGSRNTRFYYPAGIEMLAHEIKEAAALALYMRDSIANQTTVTLNAMDEPNLIPMFNAYIWAAELNFNTNKNQNTNIPELPAKRKYSFQKQYKEAGIVVDGGPSHYTVLSVNKGGVCYHYRNGVADKIDTGVVIKNGNGVLFSTQAYQTDNSLIFNEGKVVVKASFTKLRNRTPTPYQFLILRILNLTLMRNPIFSGWFKKALVKYLITAKRKNKWVNMRTIKLGENLSIQDEQLGGKGAYEYAGANRPFSAVHMASQGYWQVQDDIGVDKK